MSVPKHWSRDYLVDHPEIDDHHKELFQLTRMLDEIVITQLSDAKLHVMILFLEHYVADHFEEEETLMKDANFIGLAHHQEEHSYFRARVGLLRPLFEKKAFAHAIFELRKIIDKLTVHIQTVDVKLKAIK